MVRKPAIDGIARPQGVLDDIIRPIIQKTAGKVKKTYYARAIKATKGDYSRVIHSRPYRTADKIEFDIARKRQKSYSRKARVAVAKEKSPKKIDVLQSKARAAGHPTFYSVRRAAKGARRRGGYR